ncbi:MAG TPA: citrate synthase [Candidatus Lambdaproteobacteria bacterium]|nr:citrate synthase [Candidatus Lambdaproteobacteria bacterium]HIN46920.1 citrate synthase [Deltaproteobacteria bacterium]HIA56735.1 citrate synthase [Candidatus Lambdaproteobacteria bacterium]HIB44713.1 citrate synthase [Candidatus Lambdaproteobacteria bacterium]HIO11550.1 citrate synthase [Deltaproteobacteria bacterium]
MSAIAKLSLPDGQYLELPVLTGTANEKAIDISKLRKKTGYITLDPGFVNTGTCESAITFLDGENGILQFRGYPIEQLAAESTFLEVAYLLIHGELPDKTQLYNFVERVSLHAMIHEDMRHFFDGFSQNAHPMVILSSMISSLSAYYVEASGKASIEDLEINSARLIAKVTTIAAFAYKKSVGQPFVYPRDELSYCANFLNMMFAVPAEPYELDPEIERTLELLLILHADHEQNCSASTVRVVGSSMANVYASVASGILALWGPLHGGANQQVVQMLQQIHEDGGGISKYIEMAKNQNSEFRLMGFGHRVYKNFDPRAKILKVVCDRVLNKLGVNDPLLEIALKLEKTALSDDYFIERKLYPTLDFYTGIIYRAIGIPVNMFTVMFALGRVPGWIAQWKEMHEDPKQKIARPRQLYVGQSERSYKPIAERL